MSKPFLSFVRARWLLCLAGLGLALGAQAQALKISTDLKSLAAQAAGPQPVDHIVAVVNSEPITHQELLARIERLTPQLVRQGQPLPPRAELAQLVLERMIAERVQLQAAQAAGIRIDEATLEQAVADVARQNQLSLAQLRERLASEGMGFDRFRRELRDELLMMRLREREVDSRVRISEPEIDRFLAERRAEAAAAPTEVNIAHILVAVPENASAEQLAALQARAQGLRAQLEQGADFAELARTASDGPERANGGALGLRSAERYPPLFVQATQGLAEGGLAGPVRSGAGFHVLKLLEKKQAGALADRVTQTRARHILLKPSPRLNEAQARQQLADFKRRIEAGQAEFAQLAREFSEDGSAAAGGDLGWASPGMFVPEFEQVMDRLRPGQISEPLLSRFGLHLIQVIERRQAELSEREQRELARRELREQKADEALRSFVQELRGRAYVELREPPQ